MPVMPPIPQTPAQSNDAFITGLVGDLLRQQETTLQTRTPTFSEDTLSKLLAGQQAQAQLSPLEEQMKRVNELRRFAAPQGRGAGDVYQAANPLEHIGALMSSLAANKQYGTLEEKAKALRGQVASGQGADALMKAQLAEATLSNRTNTGANQLINALLRLRGQNQTQDRFERRLSLSERSQLFKEMKMKGSPYYVRNSKGELMHVFSDSLGNTINTETDQKVNLGADWIVVDDPNLDEILANHPKGYYKEILEDRKAYLDLSELGEASRSLSEADKQELNDEGIYTILKGVTPGFADSYVETHFNNFSPSTKRYLAAVGRVMASIRHKLYGAAVTGNEQSFLDSFSAGATGLSFDDRMHRIDNMMDDVLRAGRSISTKPTHNIYRDLPEWTPLKPTIRQNTQQVKSPTAIPDTEGRNVDSEAAAKAKALVNKAGDYATDKVNNLLSADPQTMTGDILNSFRNDLESIDVESLSDKDFEKYLKLIKEAKKKALADGQ